MRKKAREGRAREHTRDSGNTKAQSKNNSEFPQLKCTNSEHESFIENGRGDTVHSPLPMQSQATHLAEHNHKQQIMTASARQTTRGVGSQAQMSQRFRHRVRSFCNCCRFKPSPDLHPQCPALRGFSSQLADFFEDILLINELSVVVIHQEGVGSVKHDVGGTEVGVDQAATCQEPQRIDDGSLLGRVEVIKILRIRCTLQKGHLYCNLLKTTRERERERV
jgi:hypothetical protein